MGNPCRPNKIGLAGPEGAHWFEGKYCVPDEELVDAVAGSSALYWYTQYELSRIQMKALFARYHKALLSTGNHKLRRHLAFRVMSSKDEYCYK